MATKSLADSSVSAATVNSMTPRPIVSRERTGFLVTARRSWRIIQRYIWDDPDKSKEERWFLFKLDVFMLTISCLGYFSKGLDQVNISNAYVSGMKETLNLKGNKLTYAGNVFTAGYVIG
jgi:ACS family pantothenate transporter-like MFS transporter